MNKDLLMSAHKGGFDLIEYGRERFGLDFIVRTRPAYQAYDGEREAAYVVWKSELDKIVDDYAAEVEALDHTEDSLDRLKAISLVSKARQNRITDDYDQAKAALWDVYIKAVADAILALDSSKTVLTHNT